MHFRNLTDQLSNMHSVSNNKLEVDMRKKTRDGERGTTPPRVP
ncbi:unnamed protein product [Pocillopora meandrina]|uniref:Uncharacterized protein n=1 Tax=Pocillopora meandrina TaxID=46732 RepID=A0AAU9WL05_9CNID|nr:unnamed protein product [Pocillopora meandrina]